MSRVPVLTAVTDAEWEAELVASLQRGQTGVTVVRRCVDLADLLATAASGTARAALVSADLRRLDRDALTRLAQVGVAVVGLVANGDEAAERRLRQLGVETLLPVGAGRDEVVAAVTAAVAGGQDPDVPLSAALAPPATWSQADEVPSPPEPEPASRGLPSPGRVVAVWGPTGAPGRTTVAVGLASELAELGVPVLLVDADVYGGVVAQALGLLDETPGLAAACRQANAGTLDVAALARHVRSVGPALRVLTGISRAERWVEIRPASLEVVLDLARRMAAVTVVDCGFCLEEDEELSYDTAAPRRNGATLSALAGADEVVAVGAGDPAGLQRLVRGLSELREAVGDVEPTVVVNKVRPAAVSGSAEREIRAALARYAGVTALHAIPQDGPACDAAAAAGRTLSEIAPHSPARVALRALAEQLAGQHVRRHRRRLLWRRAG